MSDSSDKHKHLEFIQLTITRMAANSALLRGWTVTLVAAIFALSDTQSLSQFFFVALLPVVAFWFLDGYYLWQERQYRDLYNVVRAKKEAEIDFDLNAKKASKEIWPAAVFSWTNLIFYGLIIGLIFAVVFATPRLERWMKPRGNQTPPAPASGPDNRIINQSEKG